MKDPEATPGKSVASSEAARNTDSVVERATPPQPAPADALNVLVVDNNPAVRASAEAHLRAAGCTVMLASDGFEALSCIVKDRPSLVLADIMIPRLDGYQVCALVKSNSDYQDIPVIMLSNKDGFFDEERARLVGCDAHVSKPFTAECLTTAVNQFSQLEKEHEPFAH